MAVRPLARYLPSLNLFPHLQTGEAILAHATDVGHSVFIHQIFTKHIAWARHFSRRRNKTDAARAGRLEREEDSKQEMHTLSVGDECFGEREGSAGGEEMAKECPREGRIGGEPSRRDHAGVWEACSKPRKQGRAVHISIYVLWFLSSRSPNPTHIEAYQSVPRLPASGLRNLGL